MRRVRKAIGTLLGGVTAGAVMLIGSAAGLEVGAELAAAVVVVLATIGTYVAPKNAEA